MRIEETDNAISVFFNSDIVGDYSLCDDLTLFCKSSGLYFNESEEMYDSSLAYGKSVFITTSWSGEITGSWSERVESISALKPLNDILTKMLKASDNSFSRPIVRISLRDDDAFNTTIEKIYHITNGRFKFIPLGKQEINDILAPIDLFLYEIEFSSDKELLAYTLATQ